jgi:S-adenosylmethionine hydrolase
VGAFYAERPGGTLMAIANSWGMIEIAANEGRAIDRLGGGAPEAVPVELEVMP